MLLRLFYWSVVSPRRAFAALRHETVAARAVLLLLLRALIAPVATVANIYLHPAPMLLPPPFEVAPQDYRFAEIFWYGPFTVITMALIAAALLVVVRSRAAKDLHVDFRQIFAATSLAFFTPWLVTLPIEIAMIATGHGAPLFMVAMHGAILVWESLLLGDGLCEMFALPRSERYRLAAISLGGFVILFGAVVR